MKLISERAAIEFHTRFVIDTSLTFLFSIAVSKANFVYHFCIGKGGFGKVWRVELKKVKQYFAMKEMSKARIITKRSVKSVMNERQILEQLKHPFIVNMYYAFQDRENLYLVMDYLSGGDLRYHICRYRRFDEETTRKSTRDPFGNCECMCAVCRLLGGVPGLGSRVLPRQGHHPSRHQTREPRHRNRR